MTLAWSSSFRSPAEPSKLGLVPLTAGSVADSFLVHITSTAGLWGGGQCQPLSHGGCVSLYSQPMFNTRHRLTI